MPRFIPFSQFLTHPQKIWATNQSLPLEDVIRISGLGYMISMKWYYNLGEDGTWFKQEFVRKENGVRKEFLVGYFDPERPDVWLKGCEWVPVDIETEMVDTYYGAWLGNAPASWGVPLGNLGKLKVVGGKRKEVLKD